MSPYQKREQFFCRVLDVMDVTIWENMFEKLKPGLFNQDKKTYVFYHLSVALQTLKFTEIGWR